MKIKVTSTYIIGNSIRDVAFFTFSFYLQDLLSFIPIAPAKRKTTAKVDLSAPPEGGLIHPNQTANVVLEEVGESNGVP